MKKRILFILLILTLFIFGMGTINAETEYETMTNANGNVVNYYGTSTPIKVKKNYEERTEEFRGTWVSFYAGDINSYTSDQNMKGQLLQVLDNLCHYNMNAVVFHIRTHNDAMYATDMAPQSPYTSSADYETFDYLTWFINECHERGIEFHAWLNPYRISSGGASVASIEAKYADYPKNPAHDINNVLMNNKGEAILDPGIPEVRQYIIDTCIEIMENYDVDAIHFDDYFYISDIDDSATRKKYNKTNLSIDNFRRAQVDTFISELSDAMFAYNTEHNKCVQLGISPTAIYRNVSNYVSPTNFKYDASGTLTYPNGSGTSGWQHYGSSLYCDSKKWIDNEWIDYIVPQAYFAIDYNIASFAALCDWWAGVVKNKKVNLYMGMGYYKSRENTAYGWYNNPDEILYELRYANDNVDIDGICIYQYKYLSLDRSKECMQKLVSSYWTKCPKSPQIERYDTYFDTNEKVKNIKVHSGESVLTITWDKIENVNRYAVYKHTGTLDINDPSQMVGYAGEIENGKCGITCTDYEGITTFTIVPITKDNKYGEAASVSASNISPIDLTIGSVDLYVGTPANPGAKGVVILNAIDVNLGGEVTFKIYGSYSSDFSDSFILLDEREYFGTEVLRYDFNEYGRATYIKVVCKNNVGEFESDIYVQKLDDDATSISKYIYSYLNDFYNDIFGD